MRLRLTVIALYSAALMCLTPGSFPSLASTFIWRAVPFQQQKPVVGLDLDGEFIAAVQTSGASRPYAILELAGTDVRHAIVAPNGLSDTVWTSSIVGAGGVGADGAVVVGAGGGAALDARPGIARNLRSLT